MFRPDGMEKRIDPRLSPHGGGDGKHKKYISPSFRRGRGNKYSMNENDNKIHIAHDELPADFTLEEILAEYRQPSSVSAPKTPGRQNTPARRIAMERTDGDVSEVSFSSIDELLSDELGQSAARRPSPEQRGAPVPRTPEAPVLDARELSDSDEHDEYAGEDFSYRNISDDEDEKRGGRFRETFLAPVTALLALLALRHGERKKAETRPPMVEREDGELPDVGPDAAAKHYGAQMLSLLRRSQVATGLSLVMVYLSLAYSSFLPLFGALGSGVRALSLVLIVIQLTLMLKDLDVVTNGAMSLARKRPCYDSLAVLSSLFSLLDAAVLAASNNDAYGIPFCAVSALSLTCSLWGAYFTCKGYRNSFRLLCMSKSPGAVAAEKGVIPPETALRRSRHGADGFVSRSEEADIGEYVYSLLTPVLVVTAVVLGLLAGLLRGQAGATLHCVAVMLAASCAFSAALCYALPFSVTASRLFQSGASLAGWSGVGDIGRSRRIIITDSDLFPPGTVEIGKIRVLEGVYTDRIISYTGSVIAASGCGLARPFADLMRRNGCSIGKVEHFEPHDGGGLTAMVDGDKVCVGSSGFMNLMGVRVPQKLAERSSVFTAVNGTLVGIFSVHYTPIGSVQEALATLLHSHWEPVFAIRDFNISPLMMKKMFKMPADAFKFPAYSERFAISGAETDEDSRVAAVTAREGMGPLVEAADAGKRLYGAARLSAGISAAGSVIGLLVMFLMCWLRAFDSASAANVLLFMLLWIIPTVVISLGLRR